MIGFRRAEVQRLFENLGTVNAEGFPLENVYDVDETGITFMPPLPSVLAAKGQRAVGLTIST